MQSNALEASALLMKTFRCKSCKSVAILIAALQSISYILLGAKETLESKILQLSEFGLVRMKSSIALVPRKVWRFRILHWLHICTDYLVSMPL